MTTRMIHFSKSDETSLFDGADSATLATIDVPASIDRFEDLLTQRIQETYPDADVAGDGDRSNGYWAEGFGDLQDNIEVSYAAQQIAEALFDDGNLWMVEAE